MSNYPLSHPQRRIWYMEHINSGTSIHNIGGTIRIRGEVDHNLLQCAIRMFILRNDSIRTQFKQENGEARQYIVSGGPVVITKLDYRSHARPEEVLFRWVDSTAQEPFQIEDAPLYLFVTFILNERDQGYFVKFHHLIADGWSIQVMTQQISSIYLSLLDDREDIELEDISYRLYLEREASYLQSKRYERDKSFWMNKFENFRDYYVKGTASSVKGERQSFRLDLSTSSKIRRFVEREQLSLNVYFTTLFLLYFSKIKKKTDLVIGMPVFNRSGAREKQAFGMFTSTVPFRFIVDGREDTLSMCRRVQVELRNCYMHQKYPYDQLVHDLDLKRQGYDGIFDISLNYYGTSLTNTINGLKVENVEFYSGNQWYSLQLVIKEWDESIVLDFDYLTQEYCGEEIGRMFERLLHISDQLLSGKQTIGRLELITSHERDTVLYTHNNTDATYPNTRTVWQLFEEQVQLTPSKVAIMDGGRLLTYEALNHQANRLAHFLLEQGISNNTVVGVMVKHSIETVVAILGVLKTGAAYLPIEPEYPVDRIQHMLSDSQADAIITNYEVPRELSFAGQVFLVNSNQESFSVTNPSVKQTANALAYIMYTSGSTGKPKGIMIEHRGLVNYLWWAKQKYVRADDEVFPLYSSLAFDLTVTSIFVPLISGSCIAVYRDDEDEYVLYRILKDGLATVVKLTPSHLSLLRNNLIQNTSIRRLIVGGEDLKTALAKDIFDIFQGRIDILNEYGPTETVIGCMIHTYNPNCTRLSVPIGKPIQNVKLYILDNDLQPVPYGETGELFVAGACVGRGYRNNSELTNRLFLDSPFVQGERMYRTGDLVRYFREGDIEYLGRSDQQVKIRGHRIELGEIEQKLMMHSNVQNALVLACKDSEGHFSLIGYVVLHNDEPVNEIRKFVAHSLPGFMVPSAIIPLEALPLTSNGKVDHSRLPKAPTRQVKVRNPLTRQLSSKELAFLESVQMVLRVSYVGLEDDFYHLGGDSIKAIQISSMASQHNINIRAKNILSYPVFADMLAFIQDVDLEKSVQSSCSGSVITTPIVSWFFEQRLHNRNHYNQSILLEMNQEVRFEDLINSLNEVVRMHDALRLNYNSKTGLLFYNDKHMMQTLDIPVYDLSAELPKERFRKVEEIGESMKSSFRLESDLLFKACLFICEEDPPKLLLTAHHLVVDAYSWLIILEDLQDCLSFDSKLHNPISRKRKTSSYQEWAETLTHFSQREALLSVNYWISCASKQQLMFSVPEYNGSLQGPPIIRNVRLDRSTVNALWHQANIAFHTMPQDLIVTALALALSYLSGHTHISIELEGHGRDQIDDNLDISRTVGWFTNIYPLQLDLTDPKDLLRTIIEVKEQIRKVPHKGLSYGVLKYLQGTSFPQQTRLPVRLNFLGDMEVLSNYVSFTVNQESSGADSDSLNELNALVEIDAIKIHGELRANMKFHPSLAGTSIIHRLTESFQHYLEEVITFCLDREDSLFTPTDFDTVTLSQEELDYIMRTIK